MKSFKIFTLIVLVIGVFVFVQSSCKRPKPPKATVTVVDEENVPVENAEVVVIGAENNSYVYLSSGKKPADTAITSAAGQVSYEFKYEAIYTVKVLKKKDRVIPFDRTGSGVLILKEDKTYDEKIKIRVGTN